jgi:hypothetical protein
MNSSPTCIFLQFMQHPDTAVLFRVIDRGKYWRQTHRLVIRLSTFGEEPITIAVLVPDILNQDIMVFLGLITRMPRLYLHTDHAGRMHPPFCMTTPSDSSKYSLCSWDIIKLQLTILRTVSIVLSRTGQGTALPIRPNCVGFYLRMEAEFSPRNVFQMKPGSKKGKAVSVLN